MDTGMNPASDTGAAGVKTMDIRHAGIVVVVIEIKDADGRVIGWQLQQGTRIVQRTDFTEAWNNIGDKLRAELYPVPPEVPVVPEGGIPAPNTGDVSATDTPAPDAPSTQTEGAI